MMAIITLLLGNLKTVFIVGATVVATLILASAYDSLIDDPAVERKARKEYVAITELETMKAKHEAAVKLLDLERTVNARLEKEVEKQKQALILFQEEKDKAEIERQDLEDEIKELVIINDDVPTVGNLNVFDKLRFGR